MKIFGAAVFIYLFFSVSSSFAFTVNNEVALSDTNKLRELYSLFSEYYKNKDYKSALPYGWQVLQMDPHMFAKWIYYKMEDALWYLHDSTSLAPEEKKAVNDTIVALYNMAIENYPTDKAFFQQRKAFVAETWLNWDIVKVISEYEKAAHADTNMSSYYYNRLGQLYIKKAETDSTYLAKAIDLYQMLSNREPDNPQWQEILSQIVKNPDELLGIYKKQWEKEQQNSEKAYKYADFAQRLGKYEESVKPLEFLVSQSPEGVNYWTKLANAYQKIENWTKAEDAYKTLEKIDSQNKNHYLNLGIIYSKTGKPAAARTQYIKASEVGKNWGLPIYYEGQLYEDAARNCGDYNFDAKVVYQLAVDTYRKAYAMDPTVTQAHERANQLSVSVPTQEDYFFHQLKSGQTIPIKGECYSWIDRSIKVP